MNVKKRNYCDSEIDNLLSLRASQLKLNELLKNKSIPNNIPIHLSLGHESIAVALNRLMKLQDKLSLTHRNCIYNLARTNSLEEVLKYYFQKETNSKSFMGSMNLAIPGTGILYSSSILGNNLSLSLGFAMNNKFRKNNGISIAVSGDGAIEEGAFWEYILFAKSHKLQTLLLIENNNYSLASSISQRRAEINVLEIASSLEIPFFKTSANDYLNLKDVLKNAIKTSISGPSIIEIDVTTFNRHAGPTPGWHNDTNIISLDNGLLLGDYSNDPIYNLKKTIGNKKYDFYKNKVLEVI